MEVPAAVTMHSSETPVCTARRASSGAWPYPPGAVISSSLRSRGNSSRETPIRPLVARLYLAWERVLAHSMYQERLVRAGRAEVLMRRPFGFELARKSIRADRREQCQGR